MARRRGPAKILFVGDTHIGEAPNLAGLPLPPRLLRGEGTIAEYWTRFVQRLLMDEPAFYINTPGTKFLQHQALSIPGKAWEAGFPVSFEELGYKETGSTKLKQLSRVYLNTAAIEEARAKWIQRIGLQKDYTSLLIPMQNQAKRKDSQGYCMSSITIAHAVNPLLGPKHQVTISVSYRITEAIVKFGADLAFLHQVVIPMILHDLPIDYTLKAVNFYFASVFVGPLFFPALFPTTHPVEFLRALEDNIPYEPSGAGRHIYRSFFGFFSRCWRYRGTYYNYHLQRRMHALYERALEVGLITSDEIESYLREKGAIE